jgi:hypothetical protein
VEEGTMNYTPQHFTKCKSPSGGVKIYPWVTKICADKDV